MIPNLIFNKFQNSSNQELFTLSLPLPLHSTVYWQLVSTLFKIGYQISSFLCPNPFNGFPSQSKEINHWLPKL